MEWKSIGSRIRQKIPFLIKKAETEPEPKELPAEAVEALKLISEAVNEISLPAEAVQPEEPAPMQEILVPITERDLANSNGMIETVVSLQPQGSAPVNVKLVLEIKISHEWNPPPVPEVPLVEVTEPKKEKKEKKKKKHKHKKAKAEQK